MEKREDQQNVELKLSALMDCVPGFVCFKDGEGRWVEASASALKVLQLENGDYKGKKNTELVSPDHPIYGVLKECDFSDETAWQHGVWRGQESFRQPDGSVVVFDVIKKPKFNSDGSRKGLTVVGIDISEGKKAEVELYETQAILRAAMDNSEAGIAIADAPNGMLRYVNKAGLLIRGEGDEDVVRGVDINKYV